MQGAQMAARAAIKQLCCSALLRCCAAHHLHTHPMPCAGAGACEALASQRSSFSRPAVRCGQLHAVRQPRQVRLVRVRLQGDAGGRLRAGGLGRGRPEEPLRQRESAAVVAACSAGWRDVMHLPEGCPASHCRPHPAPAKCRVAHCENCYEDAGRCVAPYGCLPGFRLDNATNSCQQVGFVRRGGGVSGMRRGLCHGGILR